MNTYAKEYSMADVNQPRRRFLTVATSLVAGVGVISMSIPFVRSWNPSARAREAGAPVEVDFSKLEPGRMISVKWRGQPVWVLRRTKENLKNLAQPEHRDELRDPDSAVEQQQPEYARNEYRSIRSDILVVVGICTHLGCIPLYVPEGREDVPHSLYFCPCHGSKFDLAGRVFKGVPAPTNLVIQIFFGAPEDPGRRAGGSRLLQIRTGQNDYGKMARPAGLGPQAHQRKSEEPCSTRASRRTEGSRFGG